MNKKIKVLIVDDSILVREILIRGLSTDPHIEIVATASNPFEARDKILLHQPDVMTCDVEMPRMNGIEFIQKLMPQYPMPIIVVSSLSNMVFDAMNAGAVDFIAKPSMSKANNVEAFLLELIHKIKIASKSKVQYYNNELITYKLRGDKDRAKQKIIAIGASTGGTEAIFSILRQLPKDSPGIVIVQHIPPKFSTMFAKRMDDLCHLHVKEAQSGDWIEPGKALIAPGDQHMIVRRVGERLKIECFAGERVNGHCPSVDVLFESVAKAAGSDAVGVILTGMGYDGAKGLMAMRRKGARTIGQDESTSVVYGMPKAAFQIGAVEQQLRLDRIPNTILNLIEST